MSTALGPLPVPAVVEVDDDSSEPGAYRTFRAALFCGAARVGAAELVLLSRGRRGFFAGAAGAPRLCAAGAADCTPTRAAVARFGALAEAELARRKRRRLRRLRLIPRLRWMASSAL